MGYCTCDKEYSSRKNKSTVNLNYFMDTFLDVEIKYRTKLDWGDTSGWSPCLNVPNGLYNQFGWMFGWDHLEWNVDMLTIKYGGDVKNLKAIPNTFTCPSLSFLCFFGEHKQRIKNVCPWYEWDFVLGFRVDITKEPRFMELLEKSLHNEKWFDDQESTWSNVDVNISKTTDLFMVVNNNVNRS